MKDKYLLILDDTGFNKENIISEYLKDEKATFCGVVIAEREIYFFNKMMQALCEELNKKYYTNEFHFTEMYNKVGAFERLGDKEFCEIVDVMIDLLYHIGAELIVQTIGGITYKDHPNFQKDIKEKYLKPMQMSQSDKSNCLVMSVLMAKKHIEQNFDGELVGVICDEGIRKANTSVNMPSNVAGEKTIKIDFKSSKEYAPLQVADFAAWAMSRQKQILQKKKCDLTKKDIKLLELFSDFMQLFITGTLAKVQVDLDSEDIFPYDEVIMHVRQNKGLEN